MESSVGSENWYTKYIPSLLANKSIDQQVHTHIKSHSGLCKHGPMAAFAAVLVVAMHTGGRGSSQCTCTRTSTDTKGRIESHFAHHPSPILHHPAVLHHPSPSLILLRHPSFSQWVDRAVKNTFRTRFQAGLFDPIADQMYPNISGPSGQHQVPDAAEQALVLVQNPVRKATAAAGGAGGDGGAGGAGGADGAVAAGSGSGNEGGTIDSVAGTVSATASAMPVLPFASAGGDKKIAVIGPFGKGLAAALQKLDENVVVTYSAGCGVTDKVSVGTREGPPDDR
jgi:hypothetical protein